MMHTIYLLLSLALVPQTRPATAVPQWAGSDGAGPDTSASFRVITTKEEWSGLWRTLNRPAPRALNASREMAVFISIGERPTGGFNPRVVRKAVREGQLMLFYVDGKPSRGTMVTQAFTNPWVVAIVRKTSLPVVIQQSQ